MAAEEAQEVERRLAAILSADVSGYSRLMGEDDEATLKTLMAYRKVQFFLIGKHRGRVVNAPGDALLAEFSSVTDAVQCAVEIQKELADRNDQLPEHRRMEFRIGIHLGDILVKEGALYGDGVNIAARLEGLADARGVCISRAVVEQVKRRLECGIEYLGEYVVKNIAEPVEVYRVRIFPDEPPARRRHLRFSMWHGVVIGIAVVLLLEAVALMLWKDALLSTLATHTASQTRPQLPFNAESKTRLALQPLPPTLSPATTFQACQDCPEMVVVPAGSVTIGSREHEKGHLPEEGPPYRVTVSKPFAIGRFEVTFRQWDACIAAGGCSHFPQDRGWGRGNRPVIYVSWLDAKEYVTWLSDLTGHRYGLPSEAAWEYSARAGASTPYWWGEDIGVNRANCSGCGDFQEDQTVPVGSLGTNPFGLFEVHGNVWEWTADCWNGSYAGAPKDGSAVTTGNCDTHVLRGGSWGIDPSNLRAARRRKDKNTLRSGKRGFRVVMSLP